MKGSSMSTQDQQQEHTIHLTSELLAFDTYYFNFLFDYEIYFLSLKLF